ncbi:aldehyde dehydrogenase family protein [Streptomyces sp. NPDC006711]|uniref:aldehyde dehydrogenase family protein n=1 Tax=Streptomyces sp. NPDC006711 TaxID=3364762 RepID=UPI00367C9B9B
MRAPAHTYEELLGATMAQALAVSALTPASPDLVTVRSALSGRPLPPLAVCSAADARAAVARGREVSGSWLRAGAPARLRVIAGLRDEIRAHRADLTRLLRHGAGFGPADAVEECQDGERLLRHAARGGGLASHRWPRSPYASEQTGARAATVSYGDDARPLASLCEGALPALLRGGAVVTEVSARTAPVALAVTAMARRAGLPDGVWQVAVRGEAPGAMSGSGLRAVLAEHADAVAPLCCPPDPAGPWRVRSRPPGLFVLRHDGSARAAARAAVRACFARAGRGCAATPHVAVHASRAEEFLHRFSREAAASTCMTTLPDEQHLALLSEWFDACLAAGARSLLPRPRTLEHRSVAAAPVPAPVLLRDGAGLSDPRPEIPQGPVALVTAFTHWAEVLDHARRGGHHLCVFTRTPLRYLSPQFGDLPARRIHLNQAPRAGLLL